MHNPFHIKLFERAFDIYTEWKEDWKNVAKGLSKEREEKERTRERELENNRCFDGLTSMQALFFGHCFGIFEMKPNHTLRNKHHTHATFSSVRWWMHKAEQKSCYAFLNLLVSLHFFHSVEIFSISRNRYWWLEIMKQLQMKPTN